MWAKTIYDELSYFHEFTLRLSTNFEINILISMMDCFFHWSILSYHKVQSQNWLWCENFLMSESFNHFIAMYSWFDFELFPHLVIYILLSFMSHVKYIYTKYGLCYHFDARKLIINKVGKYETLYYINKLNFQILYLYKSFI